MSNSIIDMFLNNVTSQSSARSVSTKENMDWQNIFDKSLFEVFKTLNHNDRNNIVESAGRHEGKTSDISRNETQQQYVRDHLLARIASETTNVQQMANVKFMQLNNYMSTNNETEVANNGLSRKYFSNFRQDIFARIHFTSSDDGIKIYARIRKQDDEYVLDEINNLITRFGFSKLAIHEIRLNGKILDR